ncbi:hypothetical protein AALP_AA2G087200 [Arabis alpina]|uniref:Uncharacterized protein n=1 Tax=Arabis alpina TaxID=50452 RepID=A0A087HG58_ARAAL|nr:hypothetical protein AALP_AA2G087200 [Arabis alpina]
MKYKKRGNPDLPGSKLCSAESLDKLRSEFKILDEVEFVIPGSSDRADDPPPGHFTMYENSIEKCFLIFPIPSVILDYFWRHKIALAQATPRGSSGFPSCLDGLFTDFLSAEMTAEERAQVENLTADGETNPAGGQEGRVQDQPIISDEVSEVPQEKLKKSRRSKKPSRVPASNGVIPSSSARVSASGTAFEQDEESLSARRKKKRSRRSSSVGQVQSPVRAVLTDGILESVIDDSKTAAWKSCSDAQTRLGIEMDHMKSVESELQAYMQRCVEAEERAVEESAKASILQRQLTDEKTGITSRIKRETKAAIRTFATKFQGKIDRAKEKIKALDGNPKKKLVQLAPLLRPRPRPLPRPRPDDST